MVAGQDTTSLWWNTGNPQDPRQTVTYTKNYFHVWSYLGWHSWVCETMAQRPHSLLEEGGNYKQIHRFHVIAAAIQTPLQCTQCVLLHCGWILSFRAASQSRRCISLAEYSGCSLHTFMAEDHLEHCSILYIVSGTCLALIWGNNRTKIENGSLPPHSKVNAYKPVLYWEWPIQRNSAVLSLRSLKTM